MPHRGDIKPGGRTSRGGYARANFISGPPGCNESGRGSRKLAHTATPDITKKTGSKRAVIMIGVTTHDTSAMAIRNPCGIIVTRRLTAARYKGNKTSR